MRAVVQTNSIVQMNNSSNGSSSNEIASTGTDTWLVNTFTFILMVWFGRDSLLVLIVCLIIIGRLI